MWPNFPLFCKLLEIYIILQGKWYQLPKGVIYNIIIGNHPSHIQISAKTRGCGEGAMEMVGFVRMCVYFITEVAFLFYLPINSKPCAKVRQKYQQNTELSCTEFITQYREKLNTQTKRHLKHKTPTFSCTNNFITAQKFDHIIQEDP